MNWKALARVKVSGVSTVGVVTETTVPVGRSKRQVIWVNVDISWMVGGNTTVITLP